MPRRRRKVDDDDYCDSLETNYIKKSRKAGPSGTSLPHSSSSSSSAATRLAVNEALTDEEKRERKAAKKQRQRERKNALKKSSSSELASSTPLTTPTRRPPPKDQSGKKKKSPPGHAPALSTQSLALGVKILDKSVGNGPPLVERSRIRVSYIGRAVDERGKVFDRSSDFSFRLGRGEVIKGWDIGVKGMRRGGTRVIIVPPEAGYGKRDVGAGKGAKLWFQVHAL